MNKALVIGIDDYQTSPLSGCVNDATAIATLLETNGDGSPNFSVVLKTSDVSTLELNEAITELFKGDADTALLYFAGHGIINPATNAGYIVAKDGKKGSWGMSLSEILGLANNAYPHIKSTVIILDSCHSGFAGEVPALGNEQISAIGNGVTILTACHRNQTAADSDPNDCSGHGLFTEIVLDALRGASADICGRITPPSVYSHVDQTLGPWEQRPVYKANVQTFVTLRHVEPKIPLEILRRLPTYFPDATDIYALDPSYEPDRVNVPDAIKTMSINNDHVNIFKELQKCNRHGLVKPVHEEHMYYAAINSDGCRLTAMGAHYRKLAAKGRI
jgi:hypothetical protein